MLFDGDWLLGGAPFWDELLREDGRVLSAAGHQVLDDAILRRR